MLVTELYRECEGTSANYRDALCDCHPQHLYEGVLLSSWWGV